SAVTTCSSRRAADSRSPATPIYARRRSRRSRPRSRGGPGRSSTWATRAADPKQRIQKKKAGETTSLRLHGGQRDRTLRRGALPAAAATTTAIVESTAAAFATTASTFTTAIATTAAAATATESATATRAGAIFGFVHADRTAIERSSVHFTG